MYVPITDVFTLPLFVTVTLPSTASVAETPGSENSTSQVKYGFTTSYGSQTTVTDPSGVTTHSVTIPSLLKCTTYNYRVISVDLAGNVATSSNATLKTARR